MHPFCIAHKLSRWMVDVQTAARVLNLDNKRTFVQVLERPVWKETGIALRREWCGDDSEEQHNVR